MLKPQRSVWSILPAAGILVAASLALAVTASGAAAAPSLTQVPSFGSNPGNLTMYSYLPATLGPGAPLVVALHGCTQSASDYYSHSGWPQLADRGGFALVFPQQASANNSQQCFNWYTPSKDGRGQGEAASVMSMVTYAEAQYGVDPARVFVTGLSAGGGMTSDLLADYPDVFAGGAIDSGLPAQCASSLSEASTCQYNDRKLTPGQWAQKVYDSHPGYSGPWPRVAIWQGSADFTVYPVNASEERDQWTQVWGIGQAASSTRSLPGGTTESTYNDSRGQPAVALFSISGMGHGLAVAPGPAPDQCGSTGAYFLDYICSTYHTALFWGLDVGGYTYADGSNQSPRLAQVDSVRARTAALATAGWTTASRARRAVSWPR
ncbi:MAG: PHB depolymerase esterase [Pseudonocardiales bacterium]|nr:MAG: PHB depolymerase esterase [Pseudonocardiales bacterium]